MVKESLNLKILECETKVTTNARVEGYEAYSSSQPRYTPSCDSKVVSSVPKQGLSASSLCKDILRCSQMMLSYDVSSSCKLRSDKWLHGWVRWDECITQPVSVVPLWNGCRQASPGRRQILRLYGIRVPLCVRGEGLREEKVPV